MTHRRGTKSLLKRRMRRYLQQHTYYDPRIAEKVSLTNSAEVLEYLRPFATEQGVQLSDLPNTEHGLVLTDSRGRGSLQLKGYDKNGLESLPTN